MFKMIKICPDCPGGESKPISSWRHINLFNHHKTCTDCNANLIVLLQYDGTTSTYNIWKTNEEGEKPKRLKLCPLCDLPPICTWKSRKTGVYGTWQVCRAVYSFGCGSEILEFGEVFDVSFTKVLLEPSSKPSLIENTATASNTDDKKTSIIKRHPQDEKGCENYIQPTAIQKRRKLEVLVPASNPQNQPSETKRNQSTALIHVLPKKPILAESTKFQCLRNAEDRFEIPTAGRVATTSSTSITDQQRQSNDAKKFSRNTTAGVATSSIFSQRNGRIWNKIMDTKLSVTPFPIHEDQCDVDRQNQSGKDREVNEDTTGEQMHETSKSVHSARLSASLLHRYDLYYGDFGLLRFGVNVADLPYT